jgi:RND superfamily putative drug exporter
MAEPDTAQRKAYDLVTAGFGAGYNGPLLVVVDAAGSSDPKVAATGAADTITALPGVVSVSPPTFNPAGDSAMLRVVPAGAPDSTETTDLVHAIRDADAGLRARTGADLRARTGADLPVTGTTAVTIDIAAKMGDALVP